MSILSPIVLDGETIKVRPLSSVGAEELAGALLQGDSWYKDVWGINSLEKIRVQYESNLVAYKEGLLNPVVYLTSRDSKIAGKAMLMNFDQANKVTEIGGTWIVKGFQRTQVNTESKLLMLSHCFETLGLNRVEFKIDSQNERSQIAIKRIGAKFEGQLRRLKIIPTGLVRDYQIYSVIKEEWPEAKQRILALRR